MVSKQSYLTRLQDVKPIPTLSLLTTVSSNVIHCWLDGLFHCNFHFVSFPQVPLRKVWNSSNTSALRSEISFLQMMQLGLCWIDLDSPLIDWSLHIYEPAKFARDQKGFESILSVSYLIYDKQFWLMTHTYKYTRWYSESIQEWNIAHFPMHLRCGHPNVSTLLGVYLCCTMIWQNWAESDFKFRR